MKKVRIQKLGPISKQGDRYLRRILIVGAIAVLRRASQSKTDVGNVDPSIRMLDPTVTPKMRASTLLVLAPVSIRKLPFCPPSCM